MTEQQPLWWMAIGALVVLTAVIVVVLARKSSVLTLLLARLATSFGWEAPRRIWWNGAMRGRWRGMEVELRHMNRYKGIPERLLITVNAAAQARVIVKLLRGSFFFKPLATLFGPPTVEPMSLAGRERYWIRSNELAYVERLFARLTVAAALEPNLISGFDVVDLQPKQLRLLRAVDDRAVKKHFSRPLIRFRRDLELIEIIAKEEWKLAVVIVEALGLRGNGTS